MGITKYASNYKKVGEFILSETPFHTRDRILIGLKESDGTFSIKCKGNLIARHNKKKSTCFIMSPTSCPVDTSALINIHTAYQKVFLSEGVLGRFNQTFEFGYNINLKAKGEK